MPIDSAIQSPRLASAARARSPYWASCSGGTCIHAFIGRPAIGSKRMRTLQTQGAGVILTLQLEDHVVAVQPAERLAAAPLIPGMPNMDALTTSRSLVSSSSSAVNRAIPASVGLDMWGAWLIPRSVFPGPVAAGTFPLQPAQTTATWTPTRPFWK